MLSFKNNNNILYNKMSNSLANYGKTVVYSISCKDQTVNDTYIGHTTDFCQRYKCHKSSCNNELSKSYNYKLYTTIRENGGWDNWDMLIIEDYPCNNVVEARERERYWIEFLSSSLNIVIPNRSKKEYSQLYNIINRQHLSACAKIYRENNQDKIKAYIENNKEKINELKKEWYEEHKPAILEKAKHHYEEHKDEKLAYQKQYADEHKVNIKDYQTEYREKNKEKLASDKKVYRENNKEKAAAANKEWREKNKEHLKEQRSQVVTCEDCGEQYTLINKIRHLKSKKHNEITENAVTENAVIESENVVIKSGQEIQSENDEKAAKLKAAQKAYREKNAEKIKEYKRIYNEANKDKIKEKCKEYYNANADKIKESVKQYQDEHKEQANQCKLDWYHKNKDDILEKHCQKMTCECGSEFRKADLSKHLKTKKHCDFIQNTTPVASA
jgi:hypothetical protein